MPQRLPEPAGQSDDAKASTTYYADLDGDGQADVVSCVTRLATLGGSENPFPYWTYQLHTPAARGFGEPRPLALGRAGQGAPPSPSLEGKKCLDTDLVALDLDGDGASELAFAERGAAGSFRVLSVRGGALAERDLALPALVDGARVTLLDLNGDGLRDVVVTRPDELTQQGAPLGALDVYVNTGADLRPVATYDHLEVDFDDGTAVLDYDGDGREDLLVRGWSPWVLLREVGPGGKSHLQFEPVAIPFTVFIDSPDRRSFRVLDVDADGDDDIVAAELELDQIYVNGRDELRQDRLLWVRDGRRSALDDEPGGPRATTVRVDYDFLLDRSRWPGRDPAEPSRYRSDPAACAPSNGARGVLCLAGEKRVVARASSGGNGAQKLEHDFYYEGARYQRLGAGWLGFGRRQIVDRTRRLVTELAYDNASFEPAALPGRGPDDYPYADRFPLARRPRSVLTYDDSWLGGATPAENVSDVTLATTEWSKSLAEGGATWFVFAGTSHTYRYRIANFRTPGAHAFPIFGPLDPAAPAPFAHALAEVLEVDAFGNVLRARRDDGLVEEVSETPSANDAASWLLGLPTSWRHTSRPLGPGAPPAKTREATTITYEPGTPLPGRLVVRDPDDAASTLTETRAYDAYGNLTYRDRVDGQGRRRQACVAYEPEGIFPSVVTRAAGQETRFVYDRALGTTLAALDPNGLATKWSYDPFGRVTRELSPEGADVAVARARVVADDPATTADDPARFTQIDVRSSGAERRELWSAEGRLVRVESREFAGTFAVNRSYDAAGRLASQSAPTLVGREAPGHATYVYDGFDRPTRVTGADGLATTFRYEGLVTSTVGEYTPGGTGAPPARPLLRTNRLERDARGRVARAVDARGRATAYKYGAFDHLRRVTDPAGNAIAYEVDAWGRPRAVDDPDLGARRATYNAFGQLETATDAKGQLTRLVYDGLGRPTERRDADGVSTWAYDEAPFGIGKRSRSTAPGGAERGVTYDAKGRVATSTLRASPGDDVLTMTYGYDDATFGRPSTLGYPTPPGVTPYRVRYGYDAFGHLEAVTDDVSQAELWRRLAPAAEVADRQALERFGNGVHTASTFEPTNGLLTHLRSDKPGAPDAETVLQDLRYAYTPNRTLWRVDDARQGAAARETFGYDVLDRLTLDAVQGAAGPRRDATYGYDDLGNLTHKSDLGPAPLTYGQAAPGGPRRPHALTGFGGEVYEYDANGNQTRRPGARLTYNALDRPASVLATGQPFTEFFYDASGARVRKRAFGDVEVVTFDDLYERRRRSVVGESKHTFYVRAGGALVAAVERTLLGPFVTAATTRYVHPNHQGSTDVVTGASGAAVDRRSYDPFGRARRPDWSTGAPPQGSALLRRGFTGHEHDDEFGLINMKGRVYDPRVGRFLQADPFVPAPFDGQSYNRYSYVGNSPPNFTDPNGYQAEGGRTYVLPGGGSCTDLGREQACANAARGPGSPTVSVGAPPPGNASEPATQVQIGPGGFRGQAGVWQFSYGDGGLRGCSTMRPCESWEPGQSVGEPASDRRRCPTRLDSIRGSSRSLYSIDVIG